MTDNAKKDGLKDGERIAKRLARAGLCSRRDAERWIAEGRVMVNGRLLDSPAVVVTAADRIVVDGKPLAAPEPTRLWLYHKKRGLMTTHRDPQGRPTVFESLPPGMPRVISVGRLDFNSEGLLLLTNDGALARKLELPATGWLRRYRVRVHGQVVDALLARLAQGITIDGVEYGAIQASVERQKGDNAWLIIGLREGKNREIRRVMEHLGYPVSRLIRVAYGPFQLGALLEGEAKEVPGKVLAEQMGEKPVRLKQGQDRGQEVETPKARQPKPDQKPEQKPGRKPRPFRAETTRAAPFRDEAGRPDRKAGERKPGDRKPGDRKPGDRKPGGQQSAGRKPAPPAGRRPR